MLSIPIRDANFSKLQKTSCLSVTCLSLKLLISPGRRTFSYFFISGPTASANYPTNYTNLMTSPLLGSDSLFLRTSTKSLSPFKEI
jgi:hypothetical protein